MIKIFAGVAVGQPITDCLNHASVDGVALGARWDKLQTGATTFDWTALDAAISEIRAKGKQVALYISARSGGGKLLPDWLKGLGCKTYTATNFMGETHEYAIPWDQVFLGQYGLMLMAVATRYPSIERIGLSCPTLEMTIPGAAAGRVGTATYGRTTYLDAVKGMIDVHCATFQEATIHICAPIGGICGRDRDTAFYREVMAYAPAQCVCFATDLMSTGSARMTPYLDLVAVKGLAYQPIWWATGDASNRIGGTYPNNFLAMLEKAKADGAAYLEIYPQDILSTDATVQAALEAS